MRTFADALREARQAAHQPQRMALMDAPLVEGEPVDQPTELELLEARIVPTTGPRDEANPRVRCDLCGRRQLADSTAEVEPGAFACDACYVRWKRGAASV